MSVDQTNIVDFISLEGNDIVILTISDHLEWDTEGEHLLLLQEKLNSYLRFIESGEMFSVYSYTSGKNIVIRIVFLYEPNKDGIFFLENAKLIIEEAGYQFRYYQKDGDPDN